MELRTDNPLEIAVTMFLYTIVFVITGGVGILFLYLLKGFIIGIFQSIDDFKERRKLKRELEKESEKTIEELIKEVKIK